MKESLVQYIVCPCCGANFELKGESIDPEGEIVRGQLICANAHLFPVTEGIPRLVLEDNITQGQRDTKLSFEEKWRRIPQYGHEDKTREFQLNWYLQRYGWASNDNLVDFLSTRRFILDAGTGLGRDAKLYAENTRGEVFAIDISRGIDIAYSHLAPLPNLHLIQADLTRLPFGESFFDFIACDQVLHHTPDTEKSFKYLLRFLKLGGDIAVYVYKKKGPIREFCDDYIRSYSTKLPAEDCYKLARSVTRLGKSLSDLKLDIVVPEDIPILAIKAGKHDLQRFIYWNILKCFWNNEFDFETNVMINFDWYHPKYAHRYTPEEVRKWLLDAELEILNFDVSESGISIRAKK